MSSGTDKIVSSIMSEAQGKADIIMQDANAEIATITADAEKTAESEKNKILDNGKKQSDMRYQQIISEAKMNARRAELGAKEEVIEAAFAKATDELKMKASSGDDEYQDSLSKMIKEAAEEIGSDDLIIQLNEADTKIFKEELSIADFDSFALGGIKFTLGEPLEIVKGAVVKTPDGETEINVQRATLDEDSFIAKIKEAVDEIGSDDLILHFNEKDTKSFKEQLSSQCAGFFNIENFNFILGEPIDAIGGVIVKTTNGDIEVNNTIEARLERYKSVLRSEVADILFK